MNINEEMIRALQGKIDISYEEAEKYLYKAKGDIDRAVFMYREKQNSFGERIKRGMSSFMKYRLMIFKGEKIIVNIPIISLLLFFIIDQMWQRILIIVIIIIGALVTECEFKIEKELDENDLTPKKEAMNRNTATQYTHTAPVVSKNNTNQPNYSESYGHDQVKSEVIPVVDVQTKPGENKKSENSEKVIVEEMTEQTYNKDSSQSTDDEYYEFVIED